MTRRNMPTSTAAESGCNSETRILERVSVEDFDIEKILDRRRQTEIKDPFSKTIDERRHRPSVNGTGWKTTGIYRLGLRRVAESPDRAYRMLFGRRPGQGDLCQAGVRESRPEPPGLHGNDDIRPRVA